MYIGRRRRKKQERTGKLAAQYKSGLEVEVDLAVDSGGQTSSTVSAGMKVGLWG